MQLKSVQFLFLLIVLFVIFLTPSQGEAGEVMVLHSTDRSDGRTASLMQGIRDALGSDFSVSEVFLGTATDDEDHYDDQFQKLFSSQPDDSVVAVVTDGSEAFSFMRKFREDLYVGTPVIYCGQARPNPEFLRQCGNCTGVPLHDGVAATVDLIFSLVPTTETVVGILDATPGSRELRSQVEQAMEPYFSHAQLIFPGYEPGDDDGLDMAQLARVAASVPPSAAVLFLDFSVDNSGEPVLPADAVREVTRLSDAPVYVLNDQWLGAGVLGGVFVTGQTQGLRVGHLVQRVLSGERAEEMLPESPELDVVLDQTVMARFGLGRDALPPGAKGINPVPSPDIVEGVSPVWYGFAVAGLILVLVVVWVRSRATQKDRRSGD